MAQAALIPVAANRPDLQPSGVVPSVYASCAAIVVLPIEPYLATPVHSSVYPITKHFFDRTQYLIAWNATALFH